MAKFTCECGHSLSEHDTTGDYRDNWPCCHCQCTDYWRDFGEVAAELSQPVQTKQKETGHGAASIVPSV